jgi:uncharacterized SAM-binding protein YcdF (DUF218 family)
VKKLVSVSNIVIVIAVLLLLLFHGLWLNSIASLLIYQDKLVPSDAILVLGGGKAERVEQGIDLYRKKFANTIIFTGMYMHHGWHKPLTHWALEARQIALNAGVPADKAVPLFNSRSTFDDATLAKAYCLAHNYHSLIVVSEPYHTRRAHHVFMHVFKGSGIRVMLYPVQGSWYAPDSWWCSTEGLRETGSEYLKFALYFVRGRLAF